MFHLLLEWHYFVILLLGGFMINFKNIPLSEKPRERLFNYGESSLSSEELIAIILNIIKKFNKK